MFSKIPLFLNTIFFVAVVSLFLSVTAFGKENNVSEKNLIASFENDSDNPFVASGGSVCSLVTENSSNGRSSLKLEFNGSEISTYPGIILPGGMQPDWSSTRFLSMDVFLQGNENLYLSFRLDSEGSQSVFDAIRLSPGWNRNISISLSKFASKCNLKKVKQLLIYVSKPKVNSTLYIDNVRWAQTFKPFKAVEYVETLPKPIPTDEENRNGFIVYSRHYMRMTFENSRPDSRATSLHLFATKGEKEPLALNVYAIRRLSNVRVTVSDLTGPDDIVLPAKNWDVRLVKYMNKRLNYQSDYYYANAPAYLAAAELPTSVAADRSSRFWLTLAVPEDAKAGIYNGTVKISADGAEKELPISVRILSFRLPEPKGILYGQYYRLYGTHSNPKLRIKADMADMRAHGMNSLGLCIHVDEKSYTLEGENVVFKFDGSTPFEWCLDAYKELAYPEPMILLADSGQTAAQKAGKPYTKEYERVYVNFHRALAAKAKEMGWPVIYIQPVDEPAWRDPSLRDLNVYLLKLLKDNGILTEQDGPADSYFHNAAGPYADIWTYNGTIGLPEQRMRAEKDGHILTVYNYDVESYIGECDRWACGYFVWRHGLRGAYNWEYRGGNENLYDDLDAKYGDFPHVYLPEDGHPGGPSIGWETTREGIDDRRYLALCEELIARAKKQGGNAGECADQAERFLHELRDWLSASLIANRTNVAATQNLSKSQALSSGCSGKAYVNKYIGGDLKYSNNLTFDEYDTIRWLLANHILSLMQALGEDVNPIETEGFKPESVEKRLRVTSRKAASGMTGRVKPMTSVPVLKVAPTIDGDLAGDPAWENVKPVSLLLSNGTDKPEMSTLVYYGMYEGKFYVAFVCHEESIDKLTANVTKDNGPVWNDDCVEVFIDPGLTGKAYHQVLVNPRGAVAVAGTLEWAPKIEAKAVVNREFSDWTVELAIPVADMKLSPRFGLNFCRERRPLDSFELSSWAPVGNIFSQPERFGIAALDKNLSTAETVSPELDVKLSVSPKYVRLTDQYVQLQIDSVMGNKESTDNGITLTLIGAFRRIVVTVPPPLTSSIIAQLSVGDLPAGSYTIEARLGNESQESLPIATCTFQRVGVSK